MPRRPSLRQQPIPVPKQAEVIYLADRRQKSVFPDLAEIFRQATEADEPATIHVIPFGAVTRTERMRERAEERRVGWNSRSIQAVRQADERRGR
jgi:hypothetical protein